jgi:hypothetical protein
MPFPAGPLDQRVGIGGLDLVLLDSSEGFGRVVTRQIPIGDFDGSHPFFGNDGKPL